jgi:hypothetical protein
MLRSVIVDLLLLQQLHQQLQQQQLQQQLQPTQPLQLALREPVQQSQFQKFNNS